MEAGGISGSVSAQQAQQSSQARLQQSELSNSSEQIKRSGEKNEQQRRNAFQSAGLGQNVDQLA